MFGKKRRSGEQAILLAQGFRKFFFCGFAQIWLRRVEQASLQNFTRGQVFLCRSFLFFLLIPWRGRGYKSIIERFEGGTQRGFDGTRLADFAEVEVKRIDRECPRCSGKTAID